MKHSHCGAMSLLDTVHPAKKAQKEEQKPQTDICLRSSDEACRYL